jgi:hypothetical protein
MNVDLIKYYIIHDQEEVLKNNSFDISSIFIDETSNFTTCLG